MDGDNDMDIPKDIAMFFSYRCHYCGYECGRGIEVTFNTGLREYFHHGCYYYLKNKSIETGVNCLLEKHFFAPMIIYTITQDTVCNADRD